MDNTKTERIYKEISKLPYNEKTILLSRLLAEISAYIGEDQKVNFYDIKGVGKEIWEGIDAQEYVNKERTSWE